MEEQPGPALPAEATTKIPAARVVSTTWRRLSRSHPSLGGQPLDQRVAPLGIRGQKKFKTGCVAGGGADPIAHVAAGDPPGGGCHAEHGVPHRRGIAGHCGQGVGPVAVVVAGDLGVRGAFVVAEGVAAPGIQPVVGVGGRQGGGVPPPVAQLERRVFPGHTGVLAGDDNALPACAQFPDCVGVRGGQPPGQSRRSRVRGQVAALQPARLSGCSPHRRVARQPGDLGPGSQGVRQRKVPFDLHHVDQVVRPVGHTLLLQPGVQPRLGAPGMCGQGTVQRLAPGQTVAAARRQHQLVRQDHQKRNRGGSPLQLVLQRLADPALLCQRRWNSRASPAASPAASKPFHHCLRAIFSPARQLRAMLLTQRSVLHT